MKIASHEENLMLINKYDIETQDEQVKRLNESGFSATQATISRDIRALNLSKIASANGGVRYAVLNKAPIAEEKYIRTFKETVISMEIAGNLIVIKTEPGMAMAAAAVLDDEIKSPGIVGCIAGDNTIFAAVKSAANAQSVLDELKKIIE